ncbi:MAG TPA: hypothetical protein VFI47_24160 [Acidimicrobiales bacterium]|nr:hypothetical protein [Acidimicrobiales bacterium]
MPEPEHSTGDPSWAVLARRHPLTALTGAAGAVAVAGHVMLGPTVVAVPVMLAGLLLVAAAGARLLRLRRAAGPADD